ncbi:MAG: tagaturonate reductase [Saprospiraceae bacterium]|nr:tagaturonate reductase [Saprospiraceae bacterium]
MKSIDDALQDTVRILQFGGGNFMRGFFNWMLSVLHEETDFEGRAVLIKPTPSGDYDQLRTQEGRFHTILSGDPSAPDGLQVRLIDTISAIVHPYKQYDAYLATAALPSCNIIVSNTTESGIAFGGESWSDSTAVSSFPGKLTQWLYHRFQSLSDNGDCLVLPCELIEHNGQVLKESILKYAAHWDLPNTFEQWLSQHVHFCNTLVDRIVSGHPTAEVHQRVSHRLSFPDQLLVQGEVFHQWIIEASDDQLKTFLPLSQSSINVVTTNDMQVYRDLKVKILNGLHTSMVPLGLLAGHETVSDTLQDASLNQFLTNMLEKEILPTIDAEQQEKQKYAEAILARLANPEMHHQLSSIALNSLDKFAVRLLPTLISYWQDVERLPVGIVSAWAALLVFYRGHWRGQDLPLDDDPNLMASLQEGWKKVDRKEQSLAAFLDQCFTLQKNWHVDQHLLDHLIPELIHEIQELLHKEEKRS